MTASDVIARLYEAHGRGQGEWAFFANVRNATGYKMQVGYADAIAINTYPSRGMTFRGFEVKVARSDWLRELKQPEKAATFACYCDEWWIAAPPDVVQLEELPPTWGLALIQPQRILWHKAKKDLPAPKLTREFLCSVLRQVSENYTPRCTIQQQLSAEWQRGIKQGEQHQADTVATLQETNKQLQAHLDRFSRTFGGFYHSAEELARMKRTLEFGRELLMVKPGLLDTQRRLAALAETLGEAAKALPQLPPLFAEGATAAPKPETPCP